MTFEPVAIVGRACLLPGATSPDGLFEAVVGGQDLTGQVPADRWGLAPQHALGSTDASADRTWSDRGGYVTDFAFDSSGYQVPATSLESLDPLFQWLLQVGKQAVADSGQSDLRRAGAIIGNLSFPSAHMSRFAERVWLGDERADAAGIPKVDPKNRFMSGLPAHLLAEALGLGGPAFALDAACASSLYAIKLACDALQSGRTDVMLAGAVNCADDLFVHVGFCALKALSATGQSRPFHAEADGLVPGEGAAIVVLKRLADARADGDTIRGVIRGVGLSNDGRGAGLLVPSQAGQARAIASAYRMSGLTPSDIGYVECHATGTVVGDRTELASMSEVYDGLDDVPLGSLKSNVGHLITAAGAAGLIKVLSALENGVIPPSRHSGPENPALADSPFRLVTAAEPWSGPRRAAVSAFGFGGNNAHLIVEAHDPSLPASQTSRRQTPQCVAIVNQRIVLDPDAISLPLKDLKFPPRDLAAALPQQTFMLQLALEATTPISLNSERTGVFIGMGADPNVARYGARWRLAQWLAAWGQDPAKLGDARDAVVSLLESPGVVGTMPNIPANRISSQLDLGGPSMVVCAEELSGIRALEIASDALNNHEIDVAIVGAVDFADDAVHAAAAEALGLPQGRNGGVVMVLKRASDHPDSVASVTAPAPSHTESTAIDPTGVHAADGLLAVARAAEMIATSGDRTLRVNALGGQDATVHVRGGSGSLPAFTPWVRSLDLPVRWAAPEFPAVAQARPIDAKPALPPTAATPFPSAPPLPKILDWPINSNSNSSQEPVIMDHTPSVISPSVAEAPQPPPRITTAATAVPTNTQIPGDASYLFNAHRQFVEQQTLVHRAFLDMRARMQAAFIGNPGVTPDAPTLEAATAIQRQPTPQAAKPVVLAPVAIATPAAKRAPEPKAKPQLAAPKQVLPTGLTLNREQLKTHASGAISEIYGPLFAQQDGYERQVRMPEPPLLLADRMTGLDAEAGSMAKGTIWTETDVSASSWYLHDGRMPAGIMIESGQADLMLISYLGIDFVNRSERVYRLLGCELTYHAAEKTGPHGAVLPATGETLRYDIHVDGHANQGDIRLFFFHYDCRIAPTGSSPSQFSDADIRLSVREGQAGFFTEAELAESMGILWSAEDDDRALPAAKAPRFDAPVTISTRTTFNRKQLEAFASGDAYTCFGDGFELSASHTRTPRISGGRMLFLDAVTHFEPKGGPWGRGYLRAVDTINSDDWFFDGHFKNDSCMPGTLMFEGCLQTMAFYLAGLGYTLDADGWRFEPVPEVPYQLLCRGEVDRQSKELVYEIFVDEIHDGPYPTLFADILCTVDGLKAFHCRRMGLRLVPGWPMDSRPELLAEHIETKPVAQSNGFPFDYASLMSCAWGRPSDAFGPMYQIFDDTRRVARLPGPPYHFMSRVTSVDGEIGQFKSGLTIEIEYDIPEDAWYFRENGTASMPFAVLLEAALQPCGWLASAVGSATTVENDLFFRNLDGKGTVLVELLPTSGTLTTRTKITSISSSAGMIIESFDVLCFIGETAVYELKTVFGFFPAAALASQVGLPISDDQRGFIEGPSERSVDLTARDPQWFDGSLCLASPFLLMVDRVTGIWPDAGAAGLGRYRGEKRVDPQEWFFKAHFYQDPVQPGSLGIEAMIQLLQFAMLDRNMGDGIDEPRFEALMTGHEMSWKYRGQVRIHNQLIGSTIEITEVGTDENGPYAIANGSLWCDGLRIYEATGLGMRIVSGAIDTSHLDDIIDIDTAPWLTDHRPTWTVPSVPMMGIVNRLAQAASGEGRVVVGLSSVSIKRWCRLAPSITLKHEIRSDGRTANVRLLDEGGEIASGTVHLRNQYTQGPAPLPTLDAPLVDSPYETGALFHGPAFQRLITLRRNSEGASSMLSATAGEHGPLGILNTILLDAATHGIPHDDLNQWNPAIGTDMVAYPALVPEITIHGPTPTSGEVRCEVRTSGFFGSDQFPSFRLQLIVGESVWLTAHLVEALFPKGPLGSAAPLDRRAFLRDRRYVPSVALSQSESGQTVLNHDDVVNSDWLEGTVQAIYGTSDPETVAIREHLARNIGVHPSAAEAATPLNQWPLETVSQAKTTTVRSVGEPSLNIEPIREFWRNWFDRGPWPVEDLYYGLVKRFVRRVVLDDAAALATTRGRGVIYLANHQTMIESLLMSIVASAIGGAPTRTLAKDAHRDTWLGRLIEHCFSYPGVDDPGVITFVDRTDGAAQLEALSKLAADLDCGRSLLVHVEGTRALSPSPVTTVSGSFIDMALAANAAIIPIKFVGGLPITPGSERLEFPVGMGSQDIWFGAPLTSETLAALPYGERRSRVMDAINALGPAASAEQPNPGNPEFAARVDAHQQRYGVDEAHAVMAQVLVDEGLAAVAPEAPLPTDSTGPWIAELRRRLYGEPSP